MSNYWDDSLRQYTHLASRPVSLQEAQEDPRLEQYDIILPLPPTMASSSSSPLTTQLPPANAQAAPVSQQEPVPARFANNIPAPLPLTPARLSQLLHSQISNQQRGYNLSYSRNGNPPQVNVANQQQAGAQNGPNVSQAHFSQHYLTALNQPANQARPFGGDLPPTQGAMRAAHPPNSSAFALHQQQNAAPLQRPEFNPAPVLNPGHQHYPVPVSLPSDHYNQTAGGDGTGRPVLQLHEPELEEFQYARIRPLVENPDTASSLATTGRRRSAQAMSPDAIDFHMSQARALGSDGVTRRRVRMRSSDLSHILPNSPDPAAAPPTTTAAGSSTPSTHPYQAPAYSIPPADIQAYTMEAIRRQNRFYIAQAQAQRPNPLLTAANGKEKIGLDVKNDGRPEAKESEDLTVNMECKVCMSQLVDTALIPCGHAVLCRWCADQYLPNPKTTAPSRMPACPVCRRSVRQKLRIFLS